MDQTIGWPHACQAVSLPGEVCGYVASALVLATFSMQSMFKLRCAAIASNIAFIVYAGSAGLHPILVLHCLLLPLNIIRLAQLAKWPLANVRTPWAIRRE